MAAFDLESALLTSAATFVREVTVPIDHPPVIEDLSLVVSHTHTAGDLKGRIADTVTETFTSSTVEVTDVYTGEGVGEGNKSLTFRITYQDPAGTPTQEAVEKTRKAVIAALEKEGATIRGDV